MANDNWSTRKTSIPATFSTLSWQKKKLQRAHITELTTPMLIAQKKRHGRHRESTWSVYEETLWTRDHSYNERLQMLNLQSFELRRIHYVLTLNSQIVFGLTVNVKKFQLSGLSTTRGHQFKLVHEQQCRGYRRHFFTTRVVNIWNFLPKNVVNFSTLCSFKNSLYFVDFTRFLTFSWLFDVCTFNQATVSVL